MIKFKVGIHVCLKVNHVIVVSPKTAKKIITYLQVLSKDRKTYRR